MEIQYNLTGEPRKALVRAISEALGEDAIYQGAPAFAYTVDGYTISRDGAVTCPDSATREDVDRLVNTLREQGYIPVNIEYGSTDLTVEMPREGFSEEAYGNLQKIIASKAVLLKKAIGTDRLDIETTPETLRFPWFTLHGLDGEADAYTRLIDALCHMAKTQKRVTAKEHNSGNDKFTMRLFLVRLGFVGNEYKSARKILLQNLTGNSSWKSGHRPEQATANAVTNEGGVPYGK